MLGLEKECEKAFLNKVDDIKSQIHEKNLIKILQVYNRYRLEAATAGAVAIIDMDGFEGLEFVADIMGRIMVSIGREEIFDTDWIISHAENELGEVEVKNFFRNKSLINENIKTSNE